jgi:hypothetical protein
MRSINQGPITIEMSLLFQKVTNKGEDTESLQHRRRCAVKHVELEMLDAYRCALTHGRSKNSLLWGLDPNSVLFWCATAACCYRFSRVSFGRFPAGTRCSVAFNFILIL